MIRALRKLLLEHKIQITQYSPHSLSIAIALQGSPCNLSVQFGPAVGLDEAASIGYIWLPLVGMLSLFDLVQSISNRYTDLFPPFTCKKLQTEP